MVRLGFMLLCAILGSTLAVPTLSAAPGGDAKKPNLLHGTWEGSVPEVKGIRLVVSFTADGKATVETVIDELPGGANVKVDGGKKEGTYKQDDKKITITIDGMDKVVTIKELTETKMVLTNDKDKDMTFTKKKK